MKIASPNDDTLLGRCAKAVYDHGTMGHDDFEDKDDLQRIAQVVLQESGHAELVAALQEVQSKFPLSSALTEKVDSALRKAGAL